MHIVFVHRTFPAQFGHVAMYLASKKGYRCTFVSENPARQINGVECIQYRVTGGASEKNHYCSRTFENTTWHCDAVYSALKARPDIQPDLIVGHSGFGSTLFLRELYRCPIINYFEYYYHTRNSDMDFRPDFPSAEIDRLRAHVRNAMILLDLQTCEAGYSPTHYQHDRLPAAYRDKVRVIFDGLDTDVWQPPVSRGEPEQSRRFSKISFAPGTRIVTYATRGMESIRGFDIFMKMAKKLCDRRRDTIFVIAGQDRICYGGDDKFTGGKSFKDWVLSKDQYDLSRFIFLGQIPPQALAELFRLTDLHVYLTVPFVMSWSLLNALACGATVLGSNTPPVREVIEPGKTGLLADFFDVEGLAETANQVLNAPQAFQHLGTAGVEMVRTRYAIDVCLPRMVQLFEETIRSNHTTVS